MKAHRPLESVFQRKVVKKLKSLKNTWFFKASDRVRSGIPDIICSVNGHFVAMELKRDDKEKPTPLQLHTLTKIVESNAIGLVVTPENWDEVWEMLVNNAGSLK